MEVALELSAEEMHTRLEGVLANVFTDFESLEIVERLSGGASQETYRIELTRGGKPAVLALRRASGGIEGEVTAAHPGLAVEALLMQAAAQAGVPEPKVHYVLRSEDGVGAGFIMQWLDGFTLGAQIVKTPELAEIRPQLARRCGEVLAQIHGIDLVASGLDQHLQHQSAEEYVRQTWQRYQDFNTPQPMIDFTARWLLDHLPENTTPALVHNDFRNGNVMIDVSGIVAVLDWEVAYIGDPMRDLGWILTHSWRFGRDDLSVGGFGEVADLFAGYESVSGTSVDPEAVRFWQIFGSFWWSVGCLGMAEHYRNGPDKTVERPAVGRRSSECQVDCVNLLIPGSVVLEQPQTAAAAMPGMDELLTSVSDFLRDDVMAHTQGRLQFLARVAANSLDIVKREQTLAAPCLVNEEKRLRELFSEREDSTLALDDLRWQLVYALRDGSMVLDSELLHAHLRATVVNQIAIDQPRYAGFKTATSEANTT